MSEEKAQKEKKKPTQVSSSVGCVVVAIIAFLLFSMMMGSAVLLDVPFRLLTGWVFFLTNNLKALEVNWEMTACGVIALALATFGFHRSMIWVRKEKPWKWAWTLSLTTLLLSLFAASIAMTGIIHQMAWMTREPLTKSNRRVSLTYNTNNAKQIFLLLIEYDDEFGGLPDSLQDLHKKKLINSGIGELLTCRPARGQTPEPWIYLGAGTSILGETQKENPDTLPLLISPHAHDGKWVVLNHDGSVQTFRTNGLKQKFPAVVERLPNLFASE